MSSTSVVPQVFSLFAEQDSELRIKQGRVWATLGTGGDDADDNYGDHFLDAGQKLGVAKGQNLVFESLHFSMPVSFDFVATQWSIYSESIVFIA